MSKNKNKNRENQVDLNETSDATENASKNVNVDNTETTSEEISDATENEDDVKPVVFHRGNPRKRNPMSFR